VQFARLGETSGRADGFCITITHRATHRSLCSTASPRRIFLSLFNHRTLRISLPTPKMCLRGQVPQPWKTSNRMRRPNSGRFQKMPPAGASNNGRIDRSSMCAPKGPTLKEITHALSYFVPLQCNVTTPGTF
jgi:hypothetical protein